MEITTFTHGPLTDGRADWRAGEMGDMTRWAYVLSDAEVKTLGHAMRQAQADGIAIGELTKARFPLPGMEALLARILEEMETGRGLFLLRGFPVDRYSKDQLRYLYVGLCQHLGVAMAQSGGGDYLGDVRNLNVDVNSPRGRAYTSNQKLTYHSDQSDVVGLVVLRTAKEGGLSMLASALAIRNEIARIRPDLLEVLHQPFHWSWQEQQPPGAGPWYKAPIYAELDGRFSSFYIRTHIISAQRYEDVPRLTPQQIEAMDLIDSLAAHEDFNFSTMFQPGDMQFLNNHVILHSRTAFEDHDEPDRRRHLLRIWLSVPNSRALHSSRVEFFRETAAGAVRGGFTPRSVERLYETTHSVT
ncbi:MAG: TauD/TfdA family dioxygenase [Burkholderiaceae bacterium]